MYFSPSQLGHCFDTQHLEIYLFLNITGDSEYNENEIISIESVDS